VDWKSATAGAFLPLPLRAWRREKAKGAETASLKSFAMPGALGCLAEH
jgi:hypothetical protein